ncbi:unnamed protein product [Trifolium pratense]|uniref:Uncharacterized protein n=1 Tax=Trifolium pratense TaxID=57577 RepID=A0ACB0KDG7_TRIPR|nr:unnamed protein product [Trifolium pratense]
MVECHNCMKKGHIASNCCRYCKTAGHLIQNCPTRPPRSNQNKNQPRHNSSRSVITTVAANGFLESSQSTLSITNIQSLLRQLLPSGNTPAALSTTPGTGRKIGRLYELIELHVPLESSICAASTDSSIQLWHRRLAHSSIGKLRPLVSQGYLGSVINESFDCSACQTAKQPALSFNKSTLISASTFDLVHSDIWGPAPTPTMGGSRYFVIFIDDYSRFTWIYMMKNRHELSQIYTNFAKMIQTQFSKVIKVFRRDNAMEYRDSKLLSFLHEQGTLSEFSCPYTSQQNGRAERKHRHILDSVRAMLISASCPERAWGEAALTAVHIINRLPSSVIGNVSPFERLYLTTPDYKTLKVFGCACFVLLQPHEYTKLEPRARLCCFLGYGTEHKGYRCWDPISQRIRTSRHVVFWEHIMFSSLSKFKSIPSASTPLFTNPDVDYFPSDTIAGSETHVGSSSELPTPFDIPSTSSDDVSSVDPAVDTKIIILVIFISTWCYNLNRRKTHFD